MSSEPIVVNDLTLPESYAAFLRSEKSDRDYWWKLDKNLWYAMFPREEIEHPFLFSPETLIHVNQKEWADEGWAKRTKGIFFGKADGAASPGILSPRTSVLIGETSTDGPIALDFSASSSQPSVCYLNWAAPDPPRWISVVPDVDTLLSNLAVLT